MFKKTCATAIVILLLSTFVSGVQEIDTWQPFTSPEGRFSVVMPTKPKVEVKDVETAVGTLSLYAYMSSTPTAYLMASFSDYPNEPADEAQTEAVLDGVRGGVLRALGAELVSEEKITIGVNHGRDFISKKADNEKEYVVRWRIYMVGRRLYQLGVVTEKPNTDTPDAAKFFTSFQLTK